MGPPRRRAILRDYYGPGGARLAALADWEGRDEMRQGLFYRIGDRIVRANNELVDRVIGIPGQMRDTVAILRDPLQRRLLARAFIDEELLTARRRKALTSLLVWGGLLVALLVLVGLLLFRRTAIPEYESVYTLALYSLLTSLFLPTPFEVALPGARDEIGLIPTVLVASVAKTIGSYVVLLMGDKANAGINALLDRRKLLARMFHGLERFAQRFGYFAVFLLFAIPFMSDTAPLFVLAVLRMRKLPFLAVTFLAVTIRSLVYLGFFG